MNRIEIAKRIEATGIVAIVRTPTAELTASVARAILASGIDVLEISLTVPNAMEVLRQLRKESGEGVLLGAGTVLDAQSVRECVDAGAEFIVAPGTDLETIAAAHALDKPIAPGALTPTEVITAWKAGADMVKIFPCSALGGVSYLKALKAPLPHVKMMPTGGVDVNTAADFIKAGAVALGVGTVVDLKLMAEKGPAAVTGRWKQLVEVVKAARASLE